MIEQNIIEWVELGDSIQRLDLYNKKSISFFIMNYLLSQFSHFSPVFYFLIILLFFFQIIELNIVKIDISGDGILQLIKYLENLLLFDKVIKNNAMYIIVLVIMVFIYILSLVFSIVGMIIYINRKKKNRFLITTNAIINILNVYYINGPAIKILFYKFLCHDGTKTYICPIKGFWKIISIIFYLLMALYIISGVYIATLYINDIGSIAGSDVRTKINNNYTPIIVMFKLFYFIVYYFIDEFNVNNIVILIYNIFFMLSNIFISTYTYKELYYYNHYINAWFHYGWKYTTWFSICIFLKNLLKIKDITLFIILGLIIITIALYINNKHRYFELITEFNIFEGNNLKNIQIFNHRLLELLKNNDQKSKILISGVIKRFEEYISNNMELLEQYNKLLNDPHLQKKFTSENELAILSIISIIYSYNIEKSKDITDITLNMCYFLINRFKNPVYAIWLCTKLKACNNSQSFYRYTLIEEIKDFLITKMKKNTQKLRIRNVQISSAILYNRYADLFKIKIYEATCSQIEYFDILRNKIATTKTIDNYLRVGKDVLSFRQEALNLWDKIISLNPFSYESKNDFLLYIDSVLKDHILAKNEEKRFYSLQEEKLPEKDNIYYTMFNQELSSVLLADGYSFNGKIVYTTPNFPYLFMFSEKEIINTSIDDLLPDVVQNFHKYLIEDTIKNSNLAYIYKDQRDSLLKGKNGIIFNVYLYVKPVPNLLYGLIFFIYIKKNTENNFILILDENFIINGFTEINQMGSDFIWGNNYDLTHIINGHHIGLIIPELLLYLNYDIKTNTLSLPKNSIDLKGYLYPTNNFKELDERIPLILDELKTRKIMEMNNENKIGPIEEYDELIKVLNQQQAKPFSIFFRIESHSFIGDKYLYYRVYITSDLLAGNDNILNTETISKSMSNKKKNAKEYLKQTIMSRMKLKELSEDNNSNLNNQQGNQEKKDNKENQDNQENQDKNNNLKLIKLNIENKEPNKINDNLDNKNNLNQLSTFSHNNPNIELSNGKNNHSAHANTEPVVFNKIKAHILKKNDCAHVKKMRYLSYIFIPINVILILFDYFYSNYLIDQTITFLEQNKFFVEFRICSACIYSSSLNLKMLKEGYINNKICPNENCFKFYIDILKNRLLEIRDQKSKIYSFNQVFQNFINREINIGLYFDNSTNTNQLSVDMNNFLNIVISHGMKFISILNESDNIYNEIQEEYDAYVRNLLECSLAFFNSNYKGFLGSEKENLSDKLFRHIPICICIYFIFLIYTIYIYYSYIILIKDTYFFYFDKLMNFNSPNFEVYLKTLDEIKKKFRDDTNEDEEKNLDDELKDEMDEKNDYNSKIKNDEKNKKEDSLNNRSLKKKKQSKIQQQKLKNKRIISDYLFKINIILILKFGIIFVLSTSYYLASIIKHKKTKTSYYDYDKTVAEINVAYYDYFKIFLNFEEQLQILGRTKNKSMLNIPKDDTIERPKFGSYLIYIIKSSKYSKQNLELFEALYNDNACSVLISNELENEKCKSILSSILSKGFEQAIVQISTIITNVIDELNSLNENKTLKDIYNKTSIFVEYDIFMEYYMYKAFIVTKDIFARFKNDEKNIISKKDKITLLIFCIIYIILFFFLLFYIYSYKDFTGSFLSFIAIIPAKYIADDDEFYKQVIFLEPFYY